MPAYLLEGRSCKEDWQSAQRNCVPDVFEAIRRLVKLNLKVKRPTASPGSRCSWSPRNSFALKAAVRSMEKLAVKRVIGEVEES
jgi:hypothetical protein